MSSAAELLVETARRRELHHSVILHGPSPEALRDLAIRLACALNCEGAEPPDDCIACRKIMRGMHPDVHMIGVEENRKMIAVEQIREMVAGATLRPYEGRTKVFIVDGAETVSGAGANAMLKTLEEPSADTVFILLARSADLLLPTIRSRSQAIAIQPDSVAAAAGAFGASGDSLQATRLHRAAPTLPGADAAWTESTARAIVQAVARYATKRDIAALLAVAADPLCDADFSASLHLLALVLRDLASLPPEDSISPAETREIQAAIDREKLLDGAAIALRNATRLSVNTDPRLLIEQALLRIASA
jgi:DNA polymerase III gamma/tau subunit